MDWINFQKTPPKVNGLYLTALAAIPKKGSYDYSICSWDGKLFTDVANARIYPSSTISGGRVIFSASVMWYLSIVAPSL